MKLNQPYKTVLKHDFAVSLEAFIENLLTVTWEYDEDKLMVCGLAEIKSKLYSKLEAPQKEYKISFTPVQAYAVRLLFIDYLQDAKEQYTKQLYFYNRLHQIADDVHKQYN